MREEFRFFLRIGLYLLVSGAVYWFITYEWAGSILMIGIVIGAAFFVGAAGSATRLFTRRRTPAELIGFTEADDALDVQDEAMSPASIWPLLGALAMLLIALGFLFGGWFWLPGAGLAAASAWMWFTELRRVSD
jgi:hypothetical protein